MSTVGCEILIEFQKLAHQNGIPIPLPNAGLLESPTFLGRMTQMIMQCADVSRPCAEASQRVALSARTCVSPAASLDEPIGSNTCISSLIPIIPLRTRLAQAWHRHPSHPVALPQRPTTETAQAGRRSEVAHDSSWKVENLAVRHIF